MLLKFCIACVAGFTIEAINVGKPTHSLYAHRDARPVFCCWPDTSCLLRQPHQPPGLGHCAWHDCYTAGLMQWHVVTARTYRVLLLYMLIWGVWGVGCVHAHARRAAHGILLCVKEFTIICNYASGTKWPSARHPKAQALATKKKFQEKPAALVAK